jgi:hypothetical protein
MDWMNGVRMGLKCDHLWGCAITGSPLCCASSILFCLVNQVTDYGISYLLTPLYRQRVRQYYYAIYFLIDLNFFRYLVLWVRSFHGVSPPRTHLSYFIPTVNDTASPTPSADAAETVPSTSNTKVHTSSNRGLTLDR